VLFQNNIPSTGVRSLIRRAAVSGSGIATGLWLIAAGRRDTSSNLAVQANS
jgi:hypothetical protein